MNGNTRQHLELIIEKANKLHDFSFEKHVAQIGLNFKGTRQEDNTWVFEFGIPNNKERDAFLLTFRLFYQKNETISFVNLHKLLIDKSLSKDFCDNVSNLQKTYLDYITNYSNYTVDLFDGHPTRKQMLDVGLYGGLLHTNNPNFMLQYKIWTRDDIRASLFEQEITRFLLDILILIYSLSKFCQDELITNP